MKNNYYPAQINGYKLFSGAVWLLLMLLVCQPAFAAYERSSPEQRLAVFDEVWQTIRSRYYDVKLRGVDWDAQREEFRVRASAAASEKEFYQVLRQMVGSLRDSHTRIYSPLEKSDWRTPRVINVGLSVREIENDFVVTAVEKNGTAERAGIKVGDAIISIDGETARAVFNARLREQAGASTEAIKRLRAASGLLEGVAGTIARVRFRPTRGKERTASLLREWKILPNDLRAKRQGSTLIIAFDIFTPETVRDFFQILRTETRGIKSIVLDLRTNRGGSAEAMTDIASAFLPENRTIGRFIDRQGNIEVEAHTRRWLLYTANTIRLPKMPVAVLTSTATASAAEILTAALKKNNRARTLGLPTCGCVLAIKRQHTLQDGGLLEVSELDFQLDDGARLEGVGIAPDEAISVTRRDLITRRDRTLERALQILKTS